MNESTSEKNDGKVGLRLVSVSLGTLLVGVLLILASLLPIGDLAEDTLWTDEDSAAYDRVSQEYHRISYESPERAGVTKEQLDAQIEKAKQQFEALRAKLQHARSRPLDWKRYLLWAGALLAAVGSLGHLAGDRK